MTKPIKTTQLLDVAAAVLELKRQKPDLISRTLQRFSRVNNDGSKEQQSISGLRILLAEDNRVNQQCALQMLKGMECIVTIAKNGQIAVDEAKSDTFDLILMDCQMPEMDGFEASGKIRELREEALTTRVPILALTANAMEGDRERCLAAGMDDYMTKPIRKKVLTEALVAGVVSCSR